MKIVNSKLIFNAKYEKLCKINKNRFFFFTEDKEFYCFDSYLHKIFCLNNGLFILLKEEKLKEIHKKYFKFYKSVLLLN